MSVPEPISLRPFLDRLNLRSVLSPAESQAILDLPVCVRQVQTNSDFVGLGEPVRHACFVASGLVGRFGQNGDGGRQITAVHVPHDMANLQSIVAPTTSFALQALSPATIAQVPHEALQRVARQFPAIAEAFWRESAIDAAVLAEWVVNVGRRDARTRVAHLLCEIAFRVAAAKGTKAAAIPFPATQGHIADMTGLTAVHVNRTLGSLRKDGLAAVHGHIIQVLDWERLTEAGDFDAEYLGIAKSGA